MSKTQFCYLERTEVIHGGMETLGKQLWITKDTWFSLFGFVEADDIGRDRKKKK